MTSPTGKISLERVRLKVDSLPTLPELATFVLGLLDDPSTSAQDVTQVLVRDPSIAGQILKLVNSAYFGLPQKVNDLNRGIALLGFGRIKNLVLSLSLLKIFRTLTKKHRDDFARFWEHSAVVAGLMKRLALRMGRAEPEQAFVCGLLHDVGKLMFLGYFPKEYDRVVAAAEMRDVGFAEAEGEEFSTTHAEVGGWMARSWNLSKDVAEAIEGHHQAGAWKGGPLRGMLHFADYAARARGVTCAGSFGGPAYEEEAWGVLGLPQEDYFEMMGAVDSEKAIAEIILQVTGAGGKGGRG